MKNGIISRGGGGGGGEKEKKKRRGRKKLNSFDLQAKLAVPYLVFEKWRKFSSRRAGIYLLN